MNDLTTAQCREEARAAEKRLDWFAAATWWQCAIDRYPAVGAMARADIERMKARKSAAWATALSERAHDKRACLLLSAFDTLAMLDELMPAPPHPLDPSCWL